jgi:hypothetical protein
MNKNKDYMHPLEKWVMDRKWTLARFSREIGIDQGTIRNIILGYDPKLSNALKIQKFTHGDIKCEDLLPTRKRGSRAKVRNVEKPDDLDFLGSNDREHITD